MWQYDFHLFYAAGRALLAGQTPYTVPDFRSPYPLAIIFMPLALLPESIAYAAYLIGCVILLWRCLKPAQAWGGLSFPVLFTLFVGQIDLPLALIVSRYGPWTYALALLKPQLALVLLPWYLWRLKRRDWIKVLLPGLALLGVSFAMQPGWVGEWWLVLPDLSDYARHDSNLYWLLKPATATIPVILGCLAALTYALGTGSRSKSWTVLHLFAPATNIYSSAILVACMTPLEALLSWLAIFAVGGDIHSGAPLFVVGLSIMFRASPLPVLIPHAGKLLVGRITPIWNRLWIKEAAAGK